MVRRPVRIEVSDDQKNEKLAGNPLELAGSNPIIDTTCVQTLPSSQEQRMKLDVRAVNFQISDSVDEHAERRLHAALDRFEPRIGSVMLKMTDDHGPKHGTTMHCCIEAILKNGDSVIVEQDAPDLFQAIDKAAGRLKRTVRRCINRKRDSQLREARPALA
ncbi:MAG: HPF/RaiA family ribosome-associated protein [Myxococcota bacterium]